MLWSLYSMHRVLRPIPTPKHHQMWYRSPLILLLHAVRAPLIKPCRSEENKTPPLLQLRGRAACAVHLHWHISTLPHLCRILMLSVRVLVPLLVVVWRACLLHLVCLLRILCAAVAQFCRVAAGIPASAAAEEEHCSTENGEGGDGHADPNAHLGSGAEPATAAAAAVVRARCRCLGLSGTAGAMGRYPGRCRARS